MRAVILPICVVVALGLACVEAEDTPSSVHDLRVLGIQTDPPELMAPFCVFDLNDPRAAQALSVFATPVRYTALIQDPAGGGRPIEYELWACVRQGDRTCKEPGERYPLAPRAGPPLTTAPGELELTITPATEGLDGDFSDALLAKVLEKDTYRGLGGIRVPLILHLRASEEEIFAQKLMVYSCNFFVRPEGSDLPTMKQNELPVLPGVTVDGQPWGEDEVPVLKGPGPFVVQALDFSDREETYVVPSFELEPVVLEESWEVAWHADLGRFSNSESGGADIGGGEERRIESEWIPGSAATEERDVTFWFVVRDGRGGSSWLTRRAHYIP